MQKTITSAKVWYNISDLFFLTVIVLYKFVIYSYLL
jgi:hypothetical protein